MKKTAVNSADRRTSFHFPTRSMPRSNVFVRSVPVCTVHLQIRARFGAGAPGLYSRAWYLACVRSNRSKSFLYW